jgi:hypothetical protein
METPVAMKQGDASACRLLALASRQAKARLSYFWNNGYLLKARTNEGGPPQKKKGELPGRNFARLYDAAISRSAQAGRLLCALSVNIPRISHIVHSNGA